MQNIDELEARKRRVTSGLHNHRTTHGNGWRDLVHDEVQRVVEGRNRHHRPNRLARRPSQAPVTRRRDSHGDFGALQRANLMDAQLNAVDRAGHFNPRIDQRFAAFSSDLHGEVFKPLLHDLGCLVQDGCPLMRLHPGATILGKLLSAR